MNPFVLLSLIAGVLAVDERAGWQSLLAQPVFAALAVGLVTGEVSVAMPVGLALELIWLSILPMRGARKPDQIIGAVTGAGSACLLMSLSPDPRVVLVVALGVFLGLVAGELAAPVSNALSTVKNRFLGRIEFDLQSERRGTQRRLFWLHGGSIAYIFLAEAMVAFLFLSVGFSLAEWLSRHVGGSIAAGVIHWHSLIPALGVAAIIRLYWRQELKRVVVLSAVIVILVLWLR